MKNDEQGYCLLYPAEYSTDRVPGYIVINPNNAPGDMPGEAWVLIYRETALAGTADQVAQAEIAKAGSGFNIVRTELSVDGNPAIVVEGLPGPDPSRRVYVVTNDWLYTLTFMPWAPGESGPTPLEKLYDTVMGSIHFYPPA